MRLLLRRQFFLHVVELHCALLVISPVQCVQQRKIIPTINYNQQSDWCRNLRYPSKYSGTVTNALPFLYEPIILSERWQKSKSRPVGKTGSKGRKGTIHNTVYALLRCQGAERRIIYTPLSIRGRKKIAKEITIFVFRKAIIVSDQKFKR